MGRNGSFDIIVASVVKRAQKDYGKANNALILAQPYRKKDDKYYEKYYDEVWYPVSHTVHPKRAITERNRWLVDNADLLIAYVEAEGGAWKTMEYALQKGVPIVRIKRGE